MLDFIVTFINGLSLGGIYAMIALGYTMVYGIAKMLNFAHGDIIMVSGYILIVFMGITGNIPLSILISIFFAGMFGVLMEKSAYMPLRGASPLAVLITAIGVSYLLQSVAQMIFGSAPKYVVIANLGSVNLFGLSIQLYKIITLAVTIVIMVVLSLFIKFSKTGRAMIAVSEDRGASGLMGIDSNKIISITFLIGAMLASVACTLYFLLTPNINPTFGAKPGIKAFTAAVIGGIGSIPGAMIGGIFLGIIECFSNSIPVLSPYTDAIEFLILIILLLVRPTGILGKKRKEKV